MVYSVSEIEFGWKEFEDIACQQRLKVAFPKLEKIVDKWGFIRQAYMELMPEILAAAKVKPGGRIDPYFLDWQKHFSHIERIAWDSIRMRGVALYPQLPLFNYFIDFASPYLRIGLELDGGQHDNIKDRERDMRLAEYGWSIFRVSASEAIYDFLDPFSEDAADLTEREKEEAQEYWLLNTCDGVIESIKCVYFDGQIDAYDGLALLSLERHRLVDFSLPN